MRKQNTIENDICHTCTLIQIYKKTLEEKTRAIQIQQAIIENLRAERCKILLPCLN